MPKKHVLPHMKPIILAGNDPAILIIFPHKTILKSPAEYRRRLHIAPVREFYSRLLKKAARSILREHKPENFNQKFIVLGICAVTD